MKILHKDKTIYLQWSRQDFFEAGEAWSLKGYHAHPQWGSGSGSPPNGNEVKNFKMIFWPEKSIFPRKLFEKLNIFLKVLIFRKNIIKISNFQLLRNYKSKKFLMNTIISLRTWQKPQQNWLKLRRNY